MNAHDKSRGRLGVTFLLCLSVVVVFVIIYYFALINVNVTEYIEHVYKTNARLVNDKLAKLINANSLVNLPNVNLVTNNAEIDDHQKCKHGAIRMGPADGTTSYLHQCLNTCGSRGRVVEVHENEEYYSNDRRLGTGAWCVINTAECNMRTGYVVATLNSVACKSKFPNMFGGEAASTVVACHDEVYPATGSVLYDYRRNQPVDPLAVDMTHEDETLSDGSYRFACKFADDVQGNRYIANPLNRFHPMRDHCNKTLYNASRDVGARVGLDGWHCDCGAFDKTRVQHLDESDSKSTCSSCYKGITSDALHAGATYHTPYSCFTLNSNYTMAAGEFPCAGDEFVQRGKMCGVAELNIVRVEDGSDDTVRGLHSMPFANVGFYGENNLCKRSFVL